MRNVGVVICQKKILSSVMKIVGALVTWQHPEFVQAWCRVLQKFVGTLQFTGTVLCSHSCSALQVTLHCTSANVIKWLGQCSLRIHNVSFQNKIIIFLEVRMIHGPLYIKCINLCNMCSCLSCEACLSSWSGSADVNYIVISGCIQWFMCIFTLFQWAHF
jgi:hypothetical protein